MLRPSLAFCAPFGSSNPRAFMNVAVKFLVQDPKLSIPPFRLEFELFQKQCPVAVENFLKLCKGDHVLPPTVISERSFNESLQPQLTYKGSSFHRFVPKFIVQGGDLDSPKGEHQVSVFGPSFSAIGEVAQSKFDSKGLLGTATSAPTMNGSQFFILLANSAPHLNGTCICFGRCVLGLEALEKLSNEIELTGAGKPYRTEIQIDECGVL